MSFTKKAVYMSALFLAVVIALVLLVNAESGKKRERQNQAENFFTIQTFKTTTGGRGYHILAGEKVLVKQDIVPTIQTAIPFRSEDEAKKTAQLAVSKLNNKKFPTITREELDSLKIRVE